MGVKTLFQGFVHICQLAAHDLPSVGALCCCGQGIGVVVRILLSWSGFRISECISRVQRVLGNVCTSKLCWAASRILSGNIEILILILGHNATHVHAPKP